MNSTMQPAEPVSTVVPGPVGAPAGVGQVETHFKGKHFLVPSVQIGDRIVVTSGRFLRVAAVRDEELVEGDTVADPVSFVSNLKASKLNADVFTFAQRVPDGVSKFDFCIEWENAAAIRVTTFSDWWKTRTEHSIRKAVNRAKKLGVETRLVQFDDSFVEATCAIYNESPVRQGKAFWHYGKDFQSIKHSLATYLERSIFIGAYFEEQLIGFMKITWVGTTGTITQILSMKDHFDKRPNNALIAKAIEVCESKGIPYFVYGSFVYYDANSSLTQFKRRNGFESVPLPRYYIPLTVWGRIALKLKLHRGIVGNVPAPMLRMFLRARKLWFESRLRSEKPSA